MNGATLNTNLSISELDSLDLYSDELGIEIDYDPDYMELQSMVAVKAEQQYGNTIIPATPIDWTKALHKACVLFTKSKDFRLSSLITRALTHTHGIVGTLKGLEIFRVLTERYWHGAYPSINFEGQEDLLPRINAISELVSPLGLLGDLKNLEIKLGTIGKLSLGTIEKILIGKHDNSSYSRDQMVQIINSEFSASNINLEAILHLNQEIMWLDRELASKVNLEHKPEFTPLTSMLGIISKSIHSIDPKPIEDLVSHEPNPSINIVTKNESLQSRDEAIRLLDMVCSFLEKNDPANPAPLLIKRAKNMIGKDFFTILSQLAPDAIAQAELITGTDF